MGMDWPGTISVVFGWMAIYGSRTGENISKNSGQTERCALQWFQDKI